MPENENPAGLDARSYSFYSPLVLKFYDLSVHGLNNRLVWKCPTRSLVALYNEHITSNHLEVGPGTGYLLDKCIMPSPNPRLVLCDMNANCLNMASGRLRRYAPATSRLNVLEPMEGLGARFRSAGLNYVLHCLPGDLQSKRAALEHIRTWLEPRGILFGSTILAREVPVTWLARKQMNALNRNGAFSNRNDSLSALKTILGETFAVSDVQVYGCVAVFWARTAR